ncbi:MAG: methionine adenosyltransferase [Candidatus Hodarchaeaceae archaeon]|nr:methionine adenosyltransferase [Candidatus Hodarchaeaceae archaeon]
MRNIMVEEFKQTPLEEQKLEVVERKGLGHPDSICDAILDRVSVELSKEYIKKFGTIMHHNADKSLLVAGEVETRFGGGEVKQPMLLIFGDRATEEVEGVRIPVKEIAIRAAKDWIRKNLRFVDPEKHMRYQVELKPGSAALTDIFRRKGKVLSANDTSAAVGYAPMTPTERLVLKTEQFLNSSKFKKEFPATGEDVKVMGFRVNNELSLTVGMAFVDRHVESEDDYFRKKEEILDQLRAFVVKNSDFKKVDLKLNTLDARGRGVGGVYLTVLGTSADGADSGQVGRGNRPNGVIPLNRHTGSEAAAGKNPVSHVGKIYNILAHKIANEIYTQVPGLSEVYVWLVSQIGKPIDEPAIATARVITKPGVDIGSIRWQIGKTMDSELEHIDEFCKELAEGKFPVC